METLSPLESTVVEVSLVNQDQFAFSIVIVPTLPSRGRGKCMYHVIMMLLNASVLYSTLSHTNAATKL